MSGVTLVAGSLGAAASLIFTVVTGNSGGLIYGFASLGPIGSISPTTLKGSAISQCLTDPASGRDFVFSSSVPSLPQNYFTRILVETSTAGVYRSFSSASASYSTTGSGTFWLFPNGSNPVWNAVGLNRKVLIFV